VAETESVQRQRWWHWLVPITLLSPRVQVLLVSRLLSELGMATLTYGAMVHLAREGAEQIEITLVSTAGAIAALIFGLRGGIIADSVSRRVALALAYLAQAALCIVIPLQFGVSFVSLLVLVFSVRILTQVVSPAVKAAVVLVASATEVGTAITLLAMAGGVGSGVGTAILAPTLIKLVDIRWLLYLVGVILLLAAIRTLRLPSERETDARDADGEERERLSILGAGRWLVANPALATVIVSGAIVAVLNDIFESLQPVYVRDELNTDPANAIYVFAPGLVGVIAAVILSPLLVRWPGERWLIGLSVVCMSVGLILLGVINRIDGALAPYNPLGAFNRFGLHLSDAVLAAGLVAILVKFGASAATTAAQAFINRQVDYGQQGGAFGMQTLVQNGIGVGGTLVAGAVAQRYGTPVVFLVAPLVIVVVVTLIVRTGRREETPKALSS
jgi:MFS family permease